MKILGVLAALITLILAFGKRGESALPARRAGPLEAGEAAPDFNLPDQDGRNHALSSYRGRWLALYFYPKDDTPGCTRQACAFRDDIGQLRELGAEVVGVSVDDRDSHARFATKYGLPFPLLADSKGETARRYDSMWPLIGIARRNTFLIDPQGRIARIYRSASASRNSGQIIEDLKGMKADAA